MITIGSGSEWWTCSTSRMMYKCNDRRYGQTNWIRISLCVTHVGTMILGRFLGCIACALCQLHDWRRLEVKEDIGQVFSQTDHVHTTVVTWNRPVRGSRAVRCWNTQQAGLTAATATHSKQGWQQLLPHTASTCTLYTTTARVFRRTATSDWLSMTIFTICLPFSCAGVGIQTNLIGSIPEI